MNIIGYYAGVEMSARAARITGHRGFSGINEENCCGLKRLCKGRSGAETAADMSAESAALRADGRQ